MVDPIEGKDYIGYSCLVPLTQTGAQLYMQGVVKDATFPKHLVARPTESPAAILVFAIHLKDEYEYGFGKKGVSRKYSLYFWKCIYIHLKQLYPKLFQVGKLPLYAQTAEKSLEGRLKRIGFTNTNKKSADGHHIWEFI